MGWPRKPTNTAIHPYPCNEFTSEKCGAAQALWSMETRLTILFPQTRPHNVGLFLQKGSLALFLWMGSLYWAVAGNHSRSACAKCAVICSNVLSQRLDRDEYRKKNLLLQMMETSAKEPWYPRSAHVLMWREWISRCVTCFQVFRTVISLYMCALWLFVTATTLGITFCWRWFPHLPHPHTHINMWIVYIFMYRVHARMPCKNKNGDACEECCCINVLQQREHSA